MKLSAKRRQALYNAVYEPLTELRIRNQQTRLSVGELDTALFKMERQIWERILDTLALEET